MEGPVENYVDSAANGSLIAAASALMAGGGTEDAAGAIEAAVPRAAHMGRQAFAAVLGRGLANAGLLVLDPGALRRLDRVQVVVIDGAALRGDHRAVLLARGDAPGWDDDRVYEVADALLHGEEAPEPDPDELPATGARLRWVPSQGPSATPAQGLEHADLVVDGECVGQRRRRVGGRPLRDPAAADREPHRGAGGVAPCRRHRGSVRQCRRDASARYTAAEVGARPAGGSRTGVADHRAAPGLRLDRHAGRAGHRRCRVSRSTIPARPRRGPRTSSPAPIWPPRCGSCRRLPVARSASESAVRLAQGGTTLAGLLLVTGEPATGAANPMTLAALAQPGQRGRRDRLADRGLLGRQGAAAAGSHPATADRLARAGPRDRVLAAGRRRRDRWPSSPARRTGGVASTTCPTPRCSRRCASRPATW